MTGAPNLSEISPQPALQIPGIKEALRAHLRHDVRMEAGLVGSAAVVAAGFFALGLWWSSDWLHAVGTVPAAIAFVSLLSLRRRLWRYRTSRKVLRAYAWRECHMTFPPSDDVGVELADTEGKPVCRMEASHLDIARPWVSGSQTAWFAGDLRFGGVIGEPGGCGVTVPVRRVPPAGERGSDTADRTAREAGLMPKNWSPA